MGDSEKKLVKALWHIYNRPDRPRLWESGGNLPWDEPGFSERMLQEHLDESHGAASRTTVERQQQIDWLWEKLALSPGGKLLDVTCGPGLYATEFARLGCHVTGIDFAPASVEYARQLAANLGLTERCTIIQQDVRRMRLTDSSFDAAVFIYGQLAVFTREEARLLLTQIAQSLRKGGKLCIELLDQDRVSKKDSNWWFTDDKGLWGRAPFLHLGERFWQEEEGISVERFHILHLESGELEKIVLCDQSYSVAEMKEVLLQSGFRTVSDFPAWDGLPLYDAEEWVVYVATR